MDYVKALRQSNDSIGGELLFVNHVGRAKEVLSHSEDEAAKEQEGMHLSVETKVISVETWGKNLTGVKFKQDAVKDMNILSFRK